MTKVHYAVDNIDKPGMLVRLSGADTSETLSADRAEWTRIPSLVNWLWDSEGRLIPDEVGAAHRGRLGRHASPTSAVGENRLFAANEGSPPESSRTGEACLIPEASLAAGCWVTISPGLPRHRPPRPEERPADHQSGDDADCDCCRLRRQQ